jgi:hypothetical protein
MKLESAIRKTINRPKMVFLREIKHHAATKMLWEGGVFHV